MNRHRLPARRRASPSWPSLPFGLSPIGVIVAFIVAAIWVWYGLFSLLGDGLPLLGIVNAAGYQWGVLAIVCAIIAGARRAWITMAAAWIVAILSLSQVYWPLPSGGQANARMRVVTASLRTENRNMADAAAHLAALQPDILVVQEAGQPDLFRAELLRRLPGWHLAGIQNRVIASRWPVATSRVDRDIFRAVVAVPGAPITVWNVRAPKDYRGVIENRQYFLNLVQDIRATGPGIAAGDYNASPWNEGSTMVDAVMDDGYRRTRWMPGFTFPGPARRSGLLGPFITIDHIFATPDLRPLTGAVAAASKGADHLPVIVDYALPGR